MATTRKQFLPLMGLTAALAAGTFGALLLVNPHHHKEETQADRENMAKADTNGVFGGNVENPPAEANTSMPTIPAGAPATIAVQGSNAASGGCPPGQIPDPNAAKAATPASGAAATPATGAAAAPASGATATPTTGAAAAGATPAAPACIPDPNAATVATAGTGAAATPTTAATPAPTDGGSSTPGTATTTTDTAAGTASAPAATEASTSTTTTTTASTETPPAPAPADTSTASSGAASSSGSTETASAASGSGPSQAEIRRMIRREAQKIARAEVRKALRARGLNEDGSTAVAATEKPAKKSKKTTTTADTAPATDTSTTTTSTTETASTSTSTSGATPTPSTAATTEVASTTTTTTKSAKSTRTASSSETTRLPGLPGSALAQRPQADALRAWWNDTNRPIGAFTLVYAGQPKDQTSIALLFSEPPAVDSTATGIKVVDRKGATVPGTWAPAAGNPRLLLLSGLSPGRYTVVVNQSMQSTGGKKLISEQTGPVYIR